MKETVSHYRIVRELGRGGMGEVYLAEDTRLRRMVALKMLPAAVAGEPRRVQRFLREAHAASALNHPNIAVIHEIGEDDGVPFIAMEYVEGQTLSELIKHEPLELERIVDLGLQIADALDEARTKGVVHRDLKPSNIIINARGHAKILDFGLAKVTLAETPTNTADATDLKSDPGLVLGTVQYMSPEQALGRDVDHRSDLFSFGVVLYEMATGRHPFSGKSTTETIEQIVHAQPEAIARLNYNVSPELERIVRKCLEKDREWRYQSAREIVVDLKSLRRDSASGERAAAPVRQHTRRWVAPVVMGGAIVLLIAGVVAVRAPARRNRTAEPAPITTIAVLPFSSLGPGPALEYLQFALPDEVTTILSGNRALALRPFTATRRLKDADPIEAGKTLNVDKVVPGHYRSDNGALGVTLEAIDVDSNRVVWRNSISLPSAELISLRDGLSTQLRTGLLPALGLPSAREEATRPRNEEAYGLFLKASSFANDVQATREAVRLLERAVALDPTYAPAWAELGRRQYMHGAYGQAGVQAVERSRVAYGRALSLDPDLPVAARGFITWTTESGDLQTAYRHALDLVRRRPQSSDAHMALSYTLRYAGQIEKAARECDLAYRIDAHPFIRSCYMPFMILRKYDRARDFLRLDTGSEWTDTALTSLLLREKKTAEAAALLRKRPSLRGPRADAALAQCLDTGRIDPQAASEYEREFVIGVDSEPLYFFAAEVAFCGDREATLRLLRDALDRNYSVYPAIDTEPVFDAFRNDPEFLRLRADAIRHHERVTAQLQQIEREAGLP